MVNKNGLLIASIFIFLALIWGSSFIVMKKALGGMTWDEVAGLRLFLAGLVLAPFMFRRHIPDKRMLGKLFLAGIVGSGIPAFLFPLAEMKIPSATAGLLNSLSPLFALVSGILLFTQPFVPKRLSGVLIGFAGATLLILKPGEGAAETESSNWLYSFFVVIATFCYGLSVNMIQNWFSKLKPLEISGWSLMLAGIPGLCWILIRGTIPRIADNAATLESFGWVSLLAIAGTALALVVFNRLIMMTDGLLASGVTYLIPIVAAAWGIIDGEQLTWAHPTALVLILSGVYLLRRKAHTRS